MLSEKDERDMTEYFARGENITERGFFVFNESHTRSARRLPASRTGHSDP